MTFIKAIILSLLILINLNILNAKDIGFSVTQVDLIESKTGFFIGLGSGINALSFDGNKLNNMLNFDYMIGFSAYANKYLGFRFYVNGDTSFGRGDFYGAGSINADFLYDIYQSIPSGMGIGLFAGVGFGAGVGTKSILNFQSRSGLFVSFNAGIAYILSRSDRLELIARKTLRPAHDFNTVCTLDFTCSVDPKNVNPFIVGINYTHTF